MDLQVKSASVCSRFFRVNIVTAFNIYVFQIYDNEETFKVNDCVEFFGILSVDPSLATFDNR